MKLSKEALESTAVLARKKGSDYNVIDFNYPKTILAKNDGTAYAVAIFTPNKRKEAEASFGKKFKPNTQLLLGGMRTHLGTRTISEYLAALPEGIMATRAELLRLLQ